MLAALLPGWRGEAVPSFFPWHVRLALRLSVVAAWACALAWTGRPFPLLDERGREAVIARMDRSALRGLVQWWKLVALVGG